MSERDPFEQLRDLIDQPVEPQEAFADQLRMRLMSDLAASRFSHEEQQLPMDTTFISRPIRTIPVERSRRIRPATLLELAAAVLIVVGLVAAVGNGWFQREPDPSTMIPAAALQTDTTPTTEPMTTSVPETPIPIMTQEQAPVNTVETGMPTAAPDTPVTDIPGVVWTLAGPTGEDIQFGGIVVDDDIVYRLLTTPGFSGVQAIDARTGVVVWEQSYEWTGTFFAEEDDKLFFDGGDNILVASSEKTGVEVWRVQLDGSPIDIAEENDRFFVLLDNGGVASLDSAGNQLWMAQSPDNGQSTTAIMTRPTTNRIEVEEGVVAALASNGVLTGFDVNTGDVLWTHDGYDVSTTSIGEENDHFEVVSGVIDCVGGAGGALTVQMVDPQLGDIQTVSMVGIDRVAEVCAVAMQPGKAEIGEASQAIVGVGTFADASRLSIQQLRDENGQIVLIGGLDQPVIGVALDAGKAFLQADDGTLVRVDVSKQSRGDSDHDGDRDGSHDSSDDDDD